jgi:hypothetical protein
LNEFVSLARVVSLKSRQRNITFRGQDAIAKVIITCWYFDPDANMLCCAAIPSI